MYFSVHDVLFHSHQYQTFALPRYQAVLKWSFADTGTQSHFSPRIHDWTIPQSILSPWFCTYFTSPALVRKSTNIFLRNLEKKCKLVSLWNRMSLQCFWTHAKTSTLIFAIYHTTEPKSAATYIPKFAKVVSRKNFLFKKNKPFSIFFHARNGILSFSPQCFLYLLNSKPINIFLSAFISKFCRKLDATIKKLAVSEAIVSP